jgi:hypothetical protein
VLFNAGVAGVVIAAIVAGWLVPKPTHDRALEESAKKDLEIGRLQEALALERQRSNDTTQAGQVAIRLVEGLVKLEGPRPMRWPWRSRREERDRVAAERLAAAGREVELSRRRLADAHERVVIPLRNYAARNHFAELIAASLAQGRRGGAPR